MTIATTCQRLTMGQAPSDTLYMRDLIHPPFTFALWDYIIVGL